MAGGWFRFSDFRQAMLFHPVCPSRASFKLLQNDQEIVRVHLRAFFGDDVLDGASHLALAIAHGIDYVLTWNCTHLANAVLQKELVEYCGYHDLHLPIVCTPETLIPRHE